MAGTCIKYNWLYAKGYHIYLHQSPCAILQNFNKNITIRLHSDTITAAIHEAYDLLVNKKSRRKQCTQQTNSIGYKKEVLT